MKWGIKLTNREIKVHENAIYAIKNNLKRLKYFHKDVDQTGNFNDYIEYHKRYNFLKQSFESTPKEDIHNEKLRRIHYTLNLLWSANDNYNFPNLYHYAVEDIKKLIWIEKDKILDDLPSYEFNVTDSNKTVNDNDGLKIFKTSQSMWSAFKSYHDIDSTAKIIFEDVVYFPSNRDDCITIFNKIEEREASQAT